MPKFYVTHRDEHGERHQIGEAFEASSPSDALLTILEACGEEDDGNYEVFALEKLTPIADKISDSWEKLKRAGKMKGSDQ